MMTTAHPAVDDRIFHREAQTLAEAGFSVCIIGQHPSSEQFGGIWIEALPNPANRRQRLLLGWTLLQLALEMGGKLFLFHDPELFGVALILSLLRNKVVYDCHENLPASMLQKDWLPRWARGLLVPAVWLVEWLCSRLISGVIVARDELMSRFPKRRTVLVRNFPRASALAVLGQGAPIQWRRNVVIYTGGLSPIRGIRELVQAFKTLETPEAELWLVGKFEAQQFEKEILASLPTNGKWLGWKEHTEVLKLYQFAKVGMLLLYPTPNHRYSLPVKLFEYLGAGLPVIASNFPELADLMGGCGYQVDPYDVEQIRDAMQRLLSEPSPTVEMSRLARKRVLTSMSWEPEGHRLIDFCSRLVSQYSGARLTASRDMLS